MNTAMKKSNKQTIKYYLNLPWTYTIELDKDHPVDEREYKGKIAYRTSPRRHFLLAKQARQTKRSLSQVLDSLIDTALDRSGN